MKYQFKQAVKIGARLYSLGFHYVSKEDVEHRFFQHLLKHGLVVPESVEVAPKLQVDLNTLPPDVKAMAEKILKKKKATSEEVVSPVVDGDESKDGESDDPSPEPGEDDKSEEKAEKKSKKRK